LQSLPEKSYFQLIAFGSKFEKYNEKPVEYNQENVKNATKIINKFGANLGGTNISGPLASIFKDECYSDINLSKNIFLLTDGDVDDREQCFNLISTNSGKFRIHSIGIGTDFDKVLIEKCGKLGKGTSSFVQEIEKINSVIIDVLNKSLRPYITDIKFEFENYKEDINANIISCSPINNFTYQNEVMNYSFILPGKKELKDLKIKIIGKDPINLIESNVTLDNLIKLEDGEEMSKMIVGKALNNNEEFKKDENKEITFAKKYQILSKNTSLFAEIINNESQQDKLIKVELKEIQEKKKYPSYSYSSRLNSLNFLSSVGSAKYDKYDMDYDCCCCEASPIRCKAKKSSPFGSNFFGNLKNKIKGIFSSSSSTKAQNIVRSAMPDDYAVGAVDDDDKECDAAYDIGDYAMEKSDEDDDYDNDIIINKSSNKNSSSNNYKSNDSNNNNEVNYTDLIMSQDIIEGSWNENNETKKLIKIITEDKFIKIRNKIKVLNKGINESKIIYTVLVILYLNKECKEKLNEYLLIIKKGYNFLLNNGIIYENIISGI
jgi:hypothetical protein